MMKFVNINKFCKKIYLYKYFGEEYSEIYKSSKYGCNRCSYCLCKNEQSFIKNNTIGIANRFSNMKLKELKEFCKDKNIHNYSKMKKEDLIKYIINNTKIEQRYIIKIHMNYNEILNKHFIISELKEKQRQFLDCIITENRVCLGILSTGYGKSICF